MQRVIVESPFAGHIERNLRYLRAALLDSLQRGEAPFASHALYPQVLNDEDPEARAVGIAAGFAWGTKADFVVMYTDLGVSPGMRQAWDVYTDLGIEVRVRIIPDWEERPTA